MRGNSDHGQKRLEEKVEERIQVITVLSWLMLVYEIYTFDKEKGYVLIGVLPERRKNPTRITKESVIRWGRMLLGGEVDGKEIFFKPIAIENPADGILWRDLSNHSINIMS